MKVKKLLLLGILGVLSLNIIGCGDTSTNVKKNASQVEFNEDDEKEEFREEEAEEEVDEEETTAKQNEEEDFSSKEKEETDEFEENESDESTQETNSDVVVIDDAETEGKILDMIEDLPTGIDWDDDASESNTTAKEDNETVDTEYETEDNHEADIAGSIYDIVAAAAVYNRIVIDTTTGKEVYIDEIKYNGETITKDGTAKYSDVDHDGEVEAICSMTTGMDGCYLILDYIDGTVYAHQLDYRSIQSVFEEGYCMGSSGADTWDIYMFKFNNTSFKRKSIAGCKEGTYFLKGKDVSEQEYNEFYNTLTEIQ